MTQPAFNLTLAGKTPLEQALLKRRIDEMLAPKRATTMGGGVGNFAQGIMGGLMGRQMTQIPEAKTGLDGFYPFGGIY